MKIEELKEWANDPDRYAHWKAYQKDTFIYLAPEILALVEAANGMGHGEEACWCGNGLGGTYGEGKVFVCDVHKARDAFNEKLETL